MNEGWVALHRRALDSDVYSDEKAWRLFTTCLLKANWSARPFQGEPIKRGQFATSTRSLAEQVGWSPATTHRIMAKLVDYGCIRVEVKQRFSVITICNYETYQDADGVRETLMKRGRNADETLMRQREQENKNNNNNNGPVADENRMPVDPDANPYQVALTPEQESRRDQIHAKLCEVLGESELEQFWIDVATDAATDAVALRVTQDLVAAIKKSNMDSPAGFFRSKYPQYLGNARRKQS